MTDYMNTDSQERSIKTDISVSEINNGSDRSGISSMPYFDENFKNDYIDDDSVESANIYSHNPTHKEKNEMRTQEISNVSYSHDECEQLFESAKAKASDSIAVDQQLEKQYAVGEQNRKQSRSTALAHIVLVINAIGGREYLFDKLKADKISSALPFETQVIHLFFGKPQTLSVVKNGSAISEEEKRKRLTHSVRLSKLAAGLRWILNQYETAAEADLSVTAIEAAIQRAGGLSKVIENQQKQADTREPAASVKVDGELLRRIFGRKLGQGSITLGNARTPGTLLMTACRVKEDGVSVELVDVVEDQADRVTSILRTCSFVDGSHVDPMIRLFSDLFRNGSVIEATKKAETEKDAIGNPKSANRQFLLRCNEDGDQEVIVCSNYTKNNPSMIATLKSPIYTEQFGPLKLNTKHRKAFEKEMETVVNQYRYDAGIGAAKDADDKLTALTVKFKEKTDAKIKLTWDVYASASKWWVINTPDRWEETIPLSSEQIAQLDGEIGKSLRKGDKRADVQVARGKLQVTVTKIANGVSETSEPSVIDVPAATNRIALSVHGDDFGKAIELAAGAKRGGTLRLSETVIGLQYETELVKYLVLMPRLVGQGLDRDPSVGSTL